MRKAGIDLIKIFKNLRVYHNIKYENTILPSCVLFYCPSTLLDVYLYVCGDKDKPYFISTICGQEAVAVVDNSFICLKPSVRGRTVLTHAWLISCLSFFHQYDWF